MEKALGILKCGAQFSLYFMSIISCRFTVNCQIYCHLESSNFLLIAILIKIEIQEMAVCAFYKQARHPLCFCIGSGICLYPATTKTLFTSEKISVILRRGLYWFFFVSCCFGCCSSAFSDKKQDKCLRNLQSLKFEILTLMKWNILM